MELFNFVMVLLSIIVGLGVTKLLTNVARQIQARGDSQYYWLHSVIVGLVFVALLQQWWESWGQRTEETWSFAVLFLMLGGPIGLYIISHLIFPKQTEGTDFKAFYFDNVRVIYALAILTTVFSTAYRPLGFGHDILDPDNISSLVMVPVFFALAVFKRPIIHEFLLPTVFVAMVLDVLVFNATIH